MRHFLVSLASLVLLVLANGCARQGYPTGGPKDETPPISLGARPANESRHFNGKEFYIQFDEYVVLKNATENVLVSPPMKEKPEFTTKGKGVLVKIKDTLQANTTYLFQFKDAIADFTEGNLLPSYEYVFSTGDSMDTLMLGGQVLDARNGKAWKDFDPKSDKVQTYKLPDDNNSSAISIHGYRGIGTLTNIKGEQARFNGRKLDNQEMKILPGELNGRPWIITVTAEDGSSTHTYKIAIKS